jgi:tetratricopeptide (TPR) repeat protein
MNDFGLLHEGRGAYARALSDYQDALKIRRGMGDERLLAQSYDNVGYIYYLQGQYDNALVYWKQALDLRRKIGEKNGIVLSVQNMGFLQTAQGNWDEAMKSFVEALQDSRAIGFKNAEAISLGNIATLSAYRGRFGPALESFAAALALLKPLDLKPALAEFTLKESAVRLELGQLEEVRARLAAAEAWLKETENREQAAELETVRGEWHAARGETDQSRRAFARAITLAKESGSPAIHLHARIASASAAAGAGDTAGPAADLSKALTEAESLGHAVLTMRAQEGLARVELARRRPTRAEELARKALLAADRTGWEAGRFRLHALLARALEARGDAAGARAAWRASAESARRLEQNVPMTIRASFLAQPAVREAITHAAEPGGKIGG